MSETLIIKGWSLFNSQQYALALETFNEALKVDPENGGAWFAKGATIASLADYKKLEQQYVEAEKMYLEALECYEKALEFDPENAFWYWSKKGVIHDRMTRYDLAKIDFEKSLELKPDFVDSIHQLGHLMNEQFSDSKAALSYFNAAIKITPGVAKLYWDRGDAYKNSGFYQEALEDYNTSIQMAPSDAAYLRRGILYNEMYQYGEAVKNYNSAIELNPNDAIAYLNRGLCYERTYRNKEAVEDYYMAIEKGFYDPAKVYRDIALIKLNSLRQPEEALKDLELAIHSEAMYGENYYLRALAHFALKNYSSAFQDLNTALAYKYEDIEVFFIRGLVHRALKNHTAAIADFSTVIQENSARADAYYYRGVTKLELNQLEEALQDLKKAQELGYAEAGEHILATELKLKQK